MTVSISITKITADHYEPGTAVGTPTPRLSWRFGGDVQDWQQTGYDIRITRASGCNTFSAQTSQSILVEWPDSPLSSREQATVEVRAHGPGGVPTGWARTQVEAALLNRDDWVAEAVTSAAPDASVDEPKRPFMVRKTFSLDTIPNHARLYITALGLYEVTVNGEAASDQVLAPGWQAYSYRLAYQTLDVTKLLRTGENVITAWVGEGWYTGRLGFGGGHRNIWGTHPALIAQLELDGKVAVHTDKSWEWSFGTLLGSEIYDGETVDTSIVSGQWNAVSLVDVPEVALVAPQAPPVRRTQELAAKQIITTPSGKTVIDFGQNLVGWIRWNKQVDGTETVNISHAEVLEHGEVGTRPLRFAKATDHITLGGVTQGYEPKFTFHGFRYAEVQGFPRAVALDDFTAIAVHSDVERTGTFESSHPQINQLYSNVVWGIRGNFVSVPTDCPQRDERLGWTADLMAIAPTASYVFGMDGLLGEWLDDVAKEQLDYGDGRPPFIVPNVPTLGGSRTDRPIPVAIWSDVVTITPVDLYTGSGDLRHLEQQYKSMTAWIDNGIPRTAAGLWETVFQFGDWLDPKAPPDSPADGLTDPTLIADIYLVNSIRIVAKVAALLGREKDAKRYREEAARVLDAFHEEYVSPNGRITSDSQCVYVCSLWFDLAKTDAQRERWIDRLETLVQKQNFRVGTGFASTPFILLVLARFGRLQSAYRMLQEGECPSWLYQVGMGATTMWERWDSMLPNGDINPGEMTSFNHYAFGSVAMFLHSIVGGLSPTSPGWKTISIHPRPGGTLTHASTSVVSPHGPVSCDWKLNENRTKISATVVVPPNTTADVHIGSVSQSVGSGTWNFVGDWADEGVWPPPQLERFPGEPVKNTIVA